MQTEMIKEIIKELDILIYKNKFQLGELENFFGESSINNY